MTVNVSQALGQMYNQYEHAASQPASNPFLTPTSVSWLIENLKSPDLRSVYVVLVDVGSDRRGPPAPSALDRPNLSVGTPLRPSGFPSQSHTFDPLCVASGTPSGI